MLNALVNGTEYRSIGGEAFDQLLAGIQDQADLELWASLDGQASLCAVLNSRCGLMIFARFTGDAGFSSRNPQVAEADCGYESFVLSNGQADDYPGSWTFARAEVLAAMSEFALYGERPSSVDWHGDSSG